MSGLGPGHDTERLLAGRRIVLVDPDPGSLDALAAGLRGYGAAVHEAATAQAALLLVEDVLPDAMVVDVALPEVDGYGLLKAVRRLPLHRGAQTPAIAMGGEADRTQRRRSLLAGFRLHLHKPLTARDLAQTLAPLLALMPTGPR
jgi:CheY-like chemotaxis protein